jgi:hypothetical protein
MRRAKKGADVLFFNDEKTRQVVSRSSIHHNCAVHVEKPCVRVNVPTVKYIGKLCRRFHHRTRGRILVYASPSFRWEDSRSLVKELCNLAHVLRSYRKL